MRFDWARVPYPPRSIRTFKALKYHAAKGKTIYIGLPHTHEILKIVIIGETIIEVLAEHQWTLLEANLDKRNNFSANFLFHNYWHAWAYVENFYLKHGALIIK